MVNVRHVKHRHLPLAAQQRWHDLVGRPALRGVVKAVDGPDALVLRQLQPRGMQLQRAGPHARHLHRLCKADGFQPVQCQRATGFALVERVLAVDEAAGGDGQLTVLEILHKGKAFAAGPQRGAVLPCLPGAVGGVQAPGQQPVPQHCEHQQHPQSAWRQDPFAGNVDKAQVHRVHQQRAGQYHADRGKQGCVQEGPHWNGEGFGDPRIGRRRAERSAIRRVAGQSAMACRAHGRLRGLKRLQERRECREM